MKEYKVTWRIELQAEDQVEAAEQALDSIVHGTSKVFLVIDTATKRSWEIDLEEVE